MISTMKRTREVAALKQTLKENIDLTETHTRHIKDLLALLDSEMDNVSIQNVLTSVIDLYASNTTIENDAIWAFYMTHRLNMEGLTVYEKLMNGDSVTVKFKEPGEGQRKTPFTVSPLYMMDETHYVTKSSAWFRWSHIGGVRFLMKRVAMNKEEMISWCDFLEEVN